MGAETKTALLNGKKLKRACLQFARENDNWRATVDADSFVFRSVKLPKQQKIDPVTNFQERVLALHTLKEMFMHLYGRFIDTRTDAAKWEAVLPRIHRWIRERPARA